MYNTQFQGIIHS